MRKQNTEILGDVIRQVLRENHLDERLYEVQLIRSWETVLGTYINSYTENLYIKNKILYARISSAAPSGESTAFVSGERSIPAASCMLFGEGEERRGRATCSPSRALSVNPSVYTAAHAAPSPDLNR